MSRVHTHTGWHCHLIYSAQEKVVVPREGKIGGKKEREREREGGRGGGGERGRER